MSLFNKILSPIASFLPENNRYERIWKLAQVDFKKRYYNTRLGLVWALINPAFRMFIYVFVFTWLGRMRFENFGFYIFGALIVWMSFSEATNKGINGLTKKKYLIENIQFNKIDLFISNVMAVFFGLLFNLGVYLVISILSGIPIYSQILWIPFLLLNHFVLCLGVSMILSVLSIFMKDILHMWVMIIMLGFWTAPIIFPQENFTGYLEFLLFINPAGGIIINMRNALLYGNPIDITFLIHCWIYAIVLYGIGQFLVKRYWQDAMEFR